MQYILILLVLCGTAPVYSQTDLPVFLTGTWKTENKDVYEHWDRLNENTLKGFSYTLQKGQISVYEYLEIKKDGHQIMYSATVLNQNSGKAVAFTLTTADSSYTFENPNHDFPKKIIYQRLNDTEILVQVSDGKHHVITYNMQKQLPETSQNNAPTSSAGYDETLAKKLGGDDYGMKNYFWVILKTGTNANADKELVAESFRGHMNNINRLVEEGKLIVAGPLGKNEQNYRGIFILNNINSLDEAKELLQTDLAVKNRLLDYDIFTWYGSAALPEYLPLAKKITKAKP